MSEQNRRRENRVKVSWKARVGSTETGIKPALVLNISLSGVYFETKMAFAVPSKILLECFIEHSADTHTFLVECEVVRCISTDRSEIRGYGAHFIKLGKSNLSLLLPIIADLWMQQREQDSPSTD